MKTVCSSNDSYNISLYCTYKCNCKCAYCNIQKCDVEITPLELDIMLSSVDRPIKHVGVLGGEPTQHSCLWDVLTVVNKYTKSYTLVTNGLFDKETRNKVADMNSVIFSIDGLPSYNDVVRDTDTHTVLDNYDFVSKYANKTSINKVIYKDEAVAGLLEDNIDYVMSLGNVNFVLCSSNYWDIASLKYVKHVLKKYKINSICKQRDSFDIRCHGYQRRIYYTDLLNSYVFGYCAEFYRKNYMDGCVDCPHKDHCYSCVAHDHVPVVNMNRCMLRCIAE